MTIRQLILTAAAAGVMGSASIASASQPVRPAASTVAPTANASQAGDRVGTTRAATKSGLGKVSMPVFFGVGIGLAALLTFVIANTGSSASPD